MIGVQIEFDETAQQVQVRENNVKVLGSFEVMVARWATHSVNIDA